MKIQSLNSCYTHHDSYPMLRRGPRGIQGPPGATSTNDNAFIYYSNGLLPGSNAQTLAVGVNSPLLLTNALTNGIGITLTATDNNILLSPGIYSVVISTYVDATGLTFDAGEFITVSPTILPSDVQLGTTSLFTITSPILQHIYIQSILAVSTPTTLIPRFTITSNLLPAITGVPFVNTTITIIRLGNVTL